MFMVALSVGRCALVVASLCLVGCYEHHTQPGSTAPDSAIVIDAGVDATFVIDAGVDGSPFVDAGVDSAVIDAAPDALPDAPTDAAPDALAPDGCRLPGQDVWTVEEPDVSFTGDQAVERLRGYRVIETPILIEGITSLDALSCLEHTDSISVSSAPDLRSLDGLQRLSVARSFQLVGTSVSSLAELGHVRGLREVNITNNALLQTLDGLVLTEVDHLALRGLENLSDISALAGLTWAGYVELTSLPALTDLSPLASLRSVGGGFWVSDIAITTLSLPLLSTVEGFLGISSNPSLRSIELPSLTRVIARPLAPDSIGLAVQGHPLLPQCVADNLAQQVGHAACQCTFNEGVGNCP